MGQSFVVLLSSNTKLVQDSQDGDHIEDAYLRKLVEYERKHSSRSNNSLESQNDDQDNSNSVNIGDKQETFTNSTTPVYIIVQDWLVGDKKVEFNLQANG